MLPLQEGTKWSDGCDLTADDVVFTFELGKTASVRYSTVWQYVDSVKATDPRTVEFKLKTKPYNPGFVKNNLASTLIVSKAVFGSIAPDKIPAETNLKPVGSGPFLLDKYDQTQVQLKRNDNYWGKTIFGTPAHGHDHPPDLQEQQRRRPEAGERRDRRQPAVHRTDLEDVGGRQAGQHLDEEEALPPAGQPSAVDLQHGQEGSGQRQGPAAIAYAINYPNIATTAMSDYSDPANASLIVPTGYESKFYDQAAVDAEGWKYDKAKAVEILEGDLKAKKGSDGIYELPDGTKLGGWKLITPTGWTDWNTACEIVAKSAQEIGIGITTEFPQSPTMYLRAPERQLRPRDVLLHRRQPGQPVDPLPRRPGRPRRTRSGQDGVLELQQVLQP